jgi:hypothetical protein
MHAQSLGRAAALVTLLGSLTVSVCRAEEPAKQYDVVIYGGTSAAVTAAVQASRMGKSVVVVSPDKHLGGLSSGGLGWTDTGNKAVIGGLAREFYHRIWQHYQKPEAWRWQTREEYGNRGQGTSAIDGQQRTMWIFEPHAAEQAFDDFVHEHQIPVFRDQWLDRSQGVAIDNGRIQSITTLSGKTFRGKMFLDATYEGDLMAAAGVSYHVGREAQSTYDEKWNGVQVGVLHHSHYFKKPISPYAVPDDPSSGLLPRISSDPPGQYGAADHRVQAYCFRMCLTDAPQNRMPFPKPAGYDASQYELLLRAFDAGWREVFHKFDPIPNHKTDTNNHGPFSTDNIGMNYDYPDASYQRRAEIIDEHRTYQQGLIYFVANDPRVPADVRATMNKWGLAKDEFVDNGHWPHQIYVREARRMIGRYVMTENELLKRRPTPESIGMGSYGMDSHNVQRYVTPDGYVQNEGDIGVGTNGPYQIALGAIVPQQGECENLLVPVCVSSSHIAFGSIRMEPVFMILGQSAATAAVQAIDGGVAVQDVEYAKLRERLLADGQVLEFDAGPQRIGVLATQLDGVVVDDDSAKTTGTWLPSTSQPKWVGAAYLHDSAVKGGSAARFEAELKPGRYQVRLSYSPNPNRATNVPVTVQHAEGTAQLKVNQTQTPPIDDIFVMLGTFLFDREKAIVTISNEGADGHVIADAVQFLPVP